MNGPQKSVTFTSNAFDMRKEKIKKERKKERKGKVHFEET